jgi:type I restriction enzyme, S subunit
MTTYDKYKPSGIEWIGDIPEHWEVKRLKYLADANPSNIDKKSKEEEQEVYLCNYVDVYKNETIHSNMDFMKATASNDQISKFILKQGDVILTKDSESANDIGIPALVTESFDNVVCGYHLTHITPKDIQGEYLFRQFQCRFQQSYFEVSANGVTRFGLGTEKFTSALVVIPEKSEQTAIATYLDQKTAEIDHIIANKQKLIALYEEEKQTIINHAVTRGVHKNVKLKPSGVEWLGDIPEHWEVKKLKYIIKGFESGVSVNSLDSSISDNQYGILKTSCVYDYTFRPEENKIILNSDELLRARTNPKKGMIIISRMNTPELVGASGYVDRDYQNLFLPDRLWQTILNEKIDLDSKWLSYILKTNRFKQLLSVLATGTSPSMKNLGQDDVLNIPIPFVSIVEQQAIVAYIEKECSRLDTLIDKFKKQIELFQEYRTTLISEVVTGKVKV